MFYFIHLQPVWKDVFAESLEEGLSNYYLMGSRFFDFHHKMQNYEDVRITYSQGQKARFNEFFSKVQHKYLHPKPEEYVATHRQCDERDFETSLRMISVLVKHNSKVFSSLPAEKKLEARANNKERFLKALPAEFKKQDYIDIARNLGIKVRSVERCMTQFIKADIIKRVELGHFSFPDKVMKTASAYYIDNQRPII